MATLGRVCASSRDRWAGGRALESVASAFGRAVAAHREAVSHIEAARARLRDRTAGDGVSEQTREEARRFAARMRRLAEGLTPGWLGCRLDGPAADLPTGVDATLGRPMPVRLGDATPVAGSGFSVVAPFVGAGHLAVDSDARDPAVACWLRGVLLRVLAALPDGALQVVAVDGATLGTVFGPFREMVEAEAWPRPAIDLPGFQQVLAEAEERIERAQGGLPDPSVLLVCVAALPEGTGRREWSRLSAIAHAGPAAGVFLLLAGYPPPQHPGGLNTAPRLEGTTQLTAVDGGSFTVSDPPGQHRFSSDGSGLAVPMRLDAGPPDALVEVVCRRLARSARVQTATDFTMLMPDEIWQQSSIDGLRTVVGREGRNECVLALDDVTPHWLVGGRTGSGKTVFLLDVLYGLASRYSPDELSLYLLDFKEGVSFAEFTPTAVDPSWIPHAHTVGIESDREYGLAVLRTLSREMTRRATELKRAGVTKLADLRTGRPDVAMPRLLAVIDEFHVLFEGNDAVAQQAVALLEELARKGRSYGVHLILASQTISGVEALFTKTDSIFGQFPLRVALAGGGGVLDQLNDGADSLPIGGAVINSAAGIPGANRVIRFPNADAGSVAAQRQLLWAARRPGSAPPTVFAGYAEQHPDQDPTFVSLTPDVRRRRALVGRAVAVGLPTAGFTLDATPGSHLAVLGTSPVGADVLYAATASLARQHAPGTARFLLAPLVPAADDASDATVEAIAAAGHPHETISAAQLRTRLAELAQATGAGSGPTTHLVIFGADIASSLLTTADPTTYRSGHDDLRDVLANGPTHGVHLLGWWRSVSRFTNDLGPTGGNEVACLVALNLPSNEVGALLGDYASEWRSRPNRALLIDRHDDRRALIVPYMRPGTLDQIDEYA
ncbi:FtsK/SpoIIIE domain-containing protein [Salinispora arenicola]|uniref:FtsK/SpoIIIE domain-containing protein n=1 Tax=Salinispora arenicola TaxID=168697 RepID=UPI00207A89B5|nr:FtsK/SpoIIIE domain-containing protein [Salinispora arenicola]MCN0176913.1 cell division protein FtsK [Salinispora arenicola]